MRWRSIGACVVAVLLSGPGCAPPPGTPVGYDAIFVRDRVQRWALQVGEQDYLQLLLHPDLYVEADLQIEDRLYPSVGVRYMGQKRQPKRSLRIRFNEYLPGQRLHGVKRINLRSPGDDPTLVREAVAYDLMRAAGLPASRASLVTLSINGGESGVYALVEQVDRKFLEDRFGEKDGQLYMLERGGTLVYEGDDPGLYPESVYELKSDHPPELRSDLVDFIRVLDGPDADPWALAQVLDVEACLRLWALHAWLVNLDSYPGTADKLYLYRDEGGRFHTIPWDLNESFGLYRGQSCDLDTDARLARDPLDPTCGGERPLVDRLLEEPAWRDAYLDHLAELVDGALEPGRVMERIECWRRVSQDAALDDRLVEDYTYEQMQASFDEDLPVGDNPRRVPGLAPFVQARDAVCRRAVEER